MRIDYEKLGMEKVIGLIMSDLSDPYQAAIWKGVESRAKQIGLGLITFVGSIPGSPVPAEATSNIAYRIATSKNLDGLVVVVSTLTSYQSTDAVRALIASKRRLPWISVGAKIGEAPSVLVDGSSALHRLVVHLIRDHGRRRIGLVTGPETHPEVPQRYKAVKHAMSLEGVELDTRLVFKGDFLPASGSAAVSSLLQNNREFDALVCMNDRMAISAIEALRRARRRVPEDVSVVGFDGIPEGESLAFPLTTVVQPLSLLGSEAVNMLRQVLDSQNVPDRTLECSLLVKETCGCAPIQVDSWRRQRAVGVTQWAGTTERTRLLQLARAGDFEAFGRAVNDLIAQSVAKNTDPEFWNSLLRCVRAECRSPWGEDLYEFGRSVVEKACAQLQTARRIAVEWHSQRMQRIGALLAGSFELGKMLAGLRTGLETLKVGEGYLALYSPGRSEQTAMLVMSPGHSMSPHDRARSFSSKEIIPRFSGTAWKQLPWVFLPLVFEGEALGYIVLPGGVDEPAIYASLKDQVSSSLKGALLLEQVRTHEQKLAREVALRTKEIRQRNSDLKAEIQRRAALEQELVDVSNRTIERLGQELHDDLSQHLAGIAMLASLTEEALDKAQRPEAVALARIAAHLRDSVLKIKHIARGMIATGLEAQGLSSAIESLIDSVKKNYQSAIEFRSAPGFAIGDSNRALQVYRIVQEALMNAVRHSRSDVITVQLRVENAHSASLDSRRMLSVEVSDRGCGNPAEFAASGLGLRIMRYRAQVAGAVLSLLPNNPGTRVVCRFAEDG